MFRFIKPRQGIMSMSRLPLSIEAHAQRGQATSVQRVQLKKAPLRPRNIALSVLTVSVCTYFYYKAVFDPLNRAAEEALADMPEQELAEEESKPLFIPFPGTTKELPPEPYRGSDPEWQEFISYSQDQAQLKKIRGELARLVEKAADSHSVLKLRCGSGMKLRRYWLDIDFPQHAPPEFVRKGIEITDDYIAWAEVPVDSLTVFRIQQALWPTALFQSFWSFTKVMIIADVGRIARLFGIRPAPVSSFDQIIFGNQQDIKGQFNDDHPSTQPRDPSKPPTAIVPLGQKTSKVRGDDQSVRQDPLGIEPGLFQALMAFKAKFAQAWRPVPCYPPRGSIIVSGFVELDAPRAWLVFDVQAAWDPKTRDFDHRSMNIRLRRMQLKRQAPVSGA